MSLGFTNAQSGAFKVSKEGFILLQFAPAAAARQYDWNRKQVFLDLLLLAKMNVFIAFHCLIYVTSYFLIISYIILQIIKNKLVCEKGCSC